MNWEKKRYYSLSDYYKETFHKKTFKVALDGGFTCPNRDGTIGTHGCTFCSPNGSGDFAQSSALTITAQIDQGIALIQDKIDYDAAFIGYFQAYTNTYDTVAVCKKRYLEAMRHPSIVGLSIATRPDCLSLGMVEMIQELNTEKPITIELGLQTIHQVTAQSIHRGYSLQTFLDAVSLLHQARIRITVHLILGLPGESKKQMLESIDFLNTLPIQGIKLAMLHILEGSQLGEDYKNTPWELLSFEEYTDFIVTAISHLGSDICIERLTGDGPEELLIAPSWTRNKRNVLNTIAQKCKSNQITQGCAYTQFK